MNDPVLILWLIPGYIALQIYRHVNPVRTKQGWEWVFQTAFAAILCFVTARGLLAGMAAILHDEGAATSLRTWWGDRIHLPYSFSLMLGVFPGSLIVGGMLCVGRFAWNDARDWFGNVFESSESDDIFFFTCKELKEKLVIVTLKSRKVYVGVLIDFTTDPDETNRFIRIMPVMSGYRSDDNMQVTYTTEYLASANTAENVTAPAILISMGDVSTLSEFDHALHERFVAEGKTHVAF
jgi:hypothetical protein